MNISLNWIKEYVDLEGVDIKDLLNRFTLSTAEIEEVIELGSEINDTVVGKVLKVAPHPESKKLKIVEVDIGKEVIISVCGAPNVKEGILIPFTKAGGSNKTIPEVKKTKLAGKESNGVCCSASEIGISEDHSGLLIIDEDVEIGMDINKIWGIRDTIIEIDNKSLTHRPDLWGHYGIAREISALTGRELKKLNLYDSTSQDLKKVAIRVLDKEKCYRYSGVTIDNINVKVSPIEMQIRLYYCGMRPISLLVDLTNYIMLELGQPMHAFDKNLIDEIVVKSTIEKKKFVTLDGIEREMPKDTLMICDSQKELAIAGIMGGKFSEVEDDTNSILLECANFDATSIRKSSTNIGLRTEASARFEKSLDPELTILAIQRFIKLLIDIDKNATVSSDLTDVYTKKYDPVKITITKSYIEKYMGQSIEENKIVKILESLWFNVKKEDKNFVIDVPSFRATKDISIKADIIEEIARIYGYDNIIPKATEIILEPLKYNEERNNEHKIKELLAENHGFSEVHTHIWEDNSLNVKMGIGKLKGLKIVNSTSEDNEFLRQSMIPKMLSFADVNRKNFDSFKIFEIGSVFPFDESNQKYNEIKTLSILIASKKVSEDDLFYKAKGIINHILSIIKNGFPKYYALNIEKLNYSWINRVKGSEIKLNNENLGYISVLHPMIKDRIDKKLNIAFVELNMDKFNNINFNEVIYSDPSKYPDVDLDLSLIVDKNVLYEKIYNDLNSFENELLNECKFVDVYSGKGVDENKKSMTFRFTLGSSYKTLSSEEIDDFQNSLIKYADDKGYKLRRT
ncbi:MAG: phenylalanine--tRNA ligase subunit beta [Clostridiales bacterium]